MICTFDCIYGTNRPALLQPPSAVAKSRIGTVAHTPAIPVPVSPNPPRRLDRTTRARHSLSGLHSPAHGHGTRAHGTLPRLGLTARGLKSPPSPYPLQASQSPPVPSLRPRTFPSRRLRSDAGQHGGVPRRNHVRACPLTPFPLAPLLSCDSVLLTHATKGSPRASQGSRGSARRAVPPLEGRRQKPELPHGLRDVLAALGSPACPCHEDARLGLGVAASARRGRSRCHYPDPQGHRPRSGARSRPRVRRAPGPVHSAHRGGAGHHAAVRVPPWLLY